MFDNEVGVLVSFYGLSVSCLIICGFGGDCVCMFENGFGMNDVFGESVDYVVMIDLL